MGLNLAATISLDGSQFERGMNRVGASAAAGIKNLIVGAVGVYTLESALSKTVETADELVTTSKRLGIGVEQLQVLRQAAKDNNVEFSALAATFEKIDIARAKALGGGADAKKFLKDFAALGVSREMLLQQSASQLFTGAISQTAQTTNPEQIALQLRDVLGKSFGGEIAVLGTNFEELGDKMKSMGGIMDATTAVELKVFKDQLSLISQIIISQLAPSLVQFGEWLLGAVGKVKTIGTYFGVVSARVERRADDSEVKPDSEGRRNFWKVLWASMTSAEAGQAYIDSDSSQKAIIDKMKANVVKMTKDLEEPAAPNFNAEKNALKDVKYKKEPDDKKNFASDSLTKVGNFLGTSKGAISGAQQQMLQHAQTTATATSQMNAKMSAFLSKGFYTKTTIAGRQGDSDYGTNFPMS